MATQKGDGGPAGALPTGAVAMGRGVGVAKLWICGYARSLCLDLRRQGVVAVQPASACGPEVARLKPYPEQIAIWLDQTTCCCLVFKNP